MSRQVSNQLIKCRLGCGETIHFIRSVKWDKDAGVWRPGSYIPVNNQLLHGDYMRTLVLIWPVEMRGQVVPKADEEMQGYEPHFGTCPVYQEREARKRNQVVQTSLFD